MSDYREELAWAAGFFDGEGHIRVSPCGNGSYRGARIAIPQIHRQTLERFRRAVGVGSVRGPQKLRSAKHNDLYWYRCSRFEHIQHIVASLWTWLSRPKREQAAKVLNEMKDYHHAISVGMI